MSPAPPLNACDCSPQETITLDRNALYDAAFKLGGLLEQLWPELQERARTPRAQRKPWRAADRLTLEQQYLVGIALDCAAVARKEVVVFLLLQYALKELRLGPDGPRVFRPDVEVRLRLIAACAASDARITSREKVN